MFLLPWRLIQWGTFAWRPTSTVTVVGTARSQEKHTKATFTAGVTVVKDDKDKALVETNKKINDIIQAIQSLGIPQADMKTQNLSIYQEEEPYTEGGRKKSRLGQWRINNSIEITLKDISKTQSLTDTLSKAGATSIYGPNFALSEDNQTGTTLLTEAVNDARKKAAILASSAGKNLGTIISVSEGNVSERNTMKFEGGGMGGGAESLPGNETVVKSVTVTWELISPIQLKLPMFK